jgi:hypothetical protein
VNRKELLNVLNIAKICISTSNVIPLFQNFCFKENKIYALNGNQGISIDYDIGVNCIVDATAITKIIASMSSEEVKLIQIGNVLKINGGKAKFSLATQDGFFDVNWWDENQKIDVITLNKDLIDKLSLALISANTSPLFEAQHGITITGDHNRLYLNSTDNRRVTDITVKLPEDLLSDWSILLPYLFCKNLITLFSKLGSDGVYTLIVGEDFVVADFQNLFLITKINPDLKLLDYKSVIGTYLIEGTSTLPIEDTFKTAVKNAATASSISKIELVNLIIEANTIELSIMSHTCEFSEIVEFHESLVDSKIAFMTRSDLLEDLCDFVTSISINIDKKAVVGRNDDLIHIIAGVQ